VLALGWLLFAFSGDLLRVGKRTAKAIAIPVLLMATMPPIVIWGTGSLETMWFALCVYQVVRRSIGIGVPAGGIGLWVLLTVTLRTDGFVFLGGFLGVLWLQSLLGSAWVDRKLVLRTAGFVFGSFVLALLFRWLVHGTLVPHTAVVKVDPSAVVFGRGLRYLGAMLLGIPSLGLLFASLAWSMTRKFHWRDPRIALCILPLTCLGLSTIVGGDFMAYARFLVPGIAPAFLALALYHGSSSQSPEERSSLAFPAAMLAGSALALTNWNFLPKAVEDTVHFRWNDEQYKTENFVWQEMKQRAFEWSHLGKALGQHTQPGEVIVRGAIGAMGYYSELFFLDTYGLVCDEVAWGESSPSNHSPGHDKQVLDAYFLPRNPDYFTYTALVSSSEPYAGIPEPFFLDPLISANFTIELIELEENPGTSLRLVRYTPAGGESP
jgi:arabinofuranosyltransferase